MVSRREAATEHWQASLALSGITDLRCSHRHIPHSLVFGVDELRDDAACLPELHHIAVQLEDELVDVAGEGGVAWVWRGESVKCGCCWGRGKSMEKGESAAAEENMAVMVHSVDNVVWEAKPDVGRHNTGPALYWACLCIGVGGRQTSHLMHR